MSNPAAELELGQPLGRQESDRSKMLRLAAWVFAAWAVLFYVFVGHVRLPVLFEVDLGDVTVPIFGRIGPPSLVEQVDETQKELRQLPDLRYDDRVDFVYFWAAANMVWSGDLAEVYPHRYEYIYYPGDPVFQMTGDDYVRSRLLTRGNYYNPPLVAILESPLTLLTFRDAFRLFTAISGAAFLAFLGLSLRAGRSLPEMPLVILGFAGFRPVHEALMMGHLSLYFVLALGAGFLALRARQPLLAGLALSFLALKPQWAVLPALFLLWRMEWRALAAMAAGSIVLFFVPFLASGVDSFSYYLQFLRDQSQVDVWNAPHMFSWNGFLSKLEPNEPLAIPNPDVDSTLMYSLQALTLAAVVVVWLGRDLYLGVAATIIGMLLGVWPLILPIGVGEFWQLPVGTHSVWYDWSFLVVAALFLVLRPASTAVRVQVAVLLLALFVAAAQSVAVVFEPDGRHGFVHWSAAGFFSITPVAFATLVWCALTTVLHGDVRLPRFRPRRAAAAATA